MKKNILLFLVLGIMSTMVVQAGEEFCEALPEEAQEVTLPLFLEEETFGEGVEDFDPFLGEEAQAAEEALENPLFQEEFLCGQEVAENDSLFSSEFGEMAQEPETFAGDEQVGDTQTLEVGDFTYVIVDGNASISKYNGTDSAVTVPTSFSYGGTSYRVRKINNFAFENCNSIKTLTIPEGITSIGYGTFKNCTNMSDIYINTNLADCSSYNTVRGEKYLDGRYRNPAYSYTSPFYNVGANSDSLTVTFGGGATQVSAYLFATGALEGEGCYAHVTKVVLGENVESVNPYAFSSCYDLKELVIGEQVTVIGSAAFSNDYHLSSITWGESLREIWGWAFYT